MTNSKNNKNQSIGFSDEERAAMKARAQELKAEERANKNKVNGEKILLEAIAAIPEPDRAMAAGYMQLLKKTRRTLFLKPGTECPRMQTRMVKLSVSFKRRVNLNTDMRH